MNKWDEARERAGKAAQAVAAFFEKNGFYCMLALCVAVIAGTAVYTRTSTPEVTPPPVMRSRIFPKRERGTKTCRRWTT